MSDNSDWDQFVDLETGEFVHPEIDKPAKPQKYLELLVILGNYVSLRSLGHICLWLVLVIIPAMGS